MNNEQELNLDYKNNLIGIELIKPVNLTADICLPQGTRLAAKAVYENSILTRYKFIINGRFYTVDTDEARRYSGTPLEELLQ